jgi:hypothetical protein
MDRAAVNRPTHYNPRNLTPGSRRRQPVSGQIWFDY